jgi:parallel beta-helix repeat protein
VETDNITIEANYIGTDVSGLTATNPNSGDGIGLLNADRNIIRNNVISAGTIGIQLVNSDANLIAGNLIGTDAAGMAKLGHGAQGVRLNAGSSHNNHRWHDRCGAQHHLR